MPVYGLTRKNSKVAYLPVRPVQPVQSAKYGAMDMTRWVQFWDLMDAVRIHGYMRAAMSVIGRTTVGAGWSLVKSEEFGEEATDRQRKRLLRFYSMPVKKWDNIKDFQSNVYKIMIGAMYLRFFGQCAYQIIRNPDGVGIGYDFLPGYVVPNVDAHGYFKTPGFYQFPYKDVNTKVEFDQKDVVYIVNPDWTGAPTGGTDMEALSDFALPIDIYLQLAAREYMKNRDKPEAFYILPADVSDEAFDAFTQAIAARYAGPTNVGRSPITVAGELDIKELSKLPEDLPYQEARKDTRQEMLAVSGVAGAKMGLTESLSSANLREARREFHETTMIPLFRLIETALYEQVHIREFGVTGWEFKFNNPDFLTLVERATVDMRYHDMGVFNPNEIRTHLGLQPRADKMGDKYVDEVEQENKDQARQDAQAAAEQARQDQQNQQGSPPEGREQRPDAPSQTGEPTNDNQDPPRGDQHDDTTERALFDELRKWKTYQLKRVKKGGSRPFATQVIPDFLRAQIQDGLVNLDTPEQVKAFFSDIEDMLREELAQ